MKDHLRSLALPLLAVSYPILFLYSHNATNLQMSVLTLPLGYSLLITALVYAVFFLFQRKPITASLSATVFVLFYYSYGFFYSHLVLFDKFPVYHFIFLPLLAVLIFYVGHFISFIKPGIGTKLQQILLVVTLFLVIFNIGGTLPVEAQKIQPKKTAAAVATASNISASSKKYPDIYFIIFDEYSGFTVMRNYFHNNDVDQFDAFLKQNHFYVVPYSHSVTINTQVEMASRLNLQQYTDTTSTDFTLQVLDNNKVFQVMKSYGYTTASLNMAFPNIVADYKLKYDPQHVSGLASDEFSQMFMNNSMLDAFNSDLENNSAEIKQRDLILDTLNQTANLSAIKSPKFVYTHVLLPHQPFIFDEYGNLLPPEDANNWHYYLGQYKYATKLAENLITKLLANADPNNPPVIIFGSDHGARNLARKSADQVILDGFLDNYQLDYAHNNMNALYLPGYDTSQIPKDLAPIDTLPLVLNYYLHAGVSVTPYP